MPDTYSGTFRRVFWIIAGVAAAAGAVVVAALWIVGVFV